MYMRMFEKALYLLEEIASAMDEPQAVMARKKAIQENVHEMLSAYSSELHQDHYAPAMQAALRANSRRKKEEIVEKARDRVSMLSKVDTFSEDVAPIPPELKKIPVIKNEMPSRPKKSKDKKP